MLEPFKNSSIARAPTPAVRSLALRDQPAYRAAYRAPECHISELLAAIVGSSRQLTIAASLLARFGSLHAISQANVLELQQVSGVGTATAARLKAAVELGRRLLLPEDAQRLSIRCPSDAAAVLVPRMGHLEQEYVYVLALDSRNQLIGEPVEVYHGALNTSMLRVGELFREAIRRNAAAIIMSHNHPSGTPAPSNEDISVTRMAVEAGRLLDVPVADHLIIGGHGLFTSLKEKGLGFGNAR